MFKSLKKYSKIVSLSTILLSTGCTPLHHTNNQTNSKIHLGEQSGALKSLQATKYSNDLAFNSEFDPKNVTETRFNDYFNAVSDKLQYELWAANCSANVLNCDVSNSENQQEEINAKYAFLKSEASKIGIDVLDFDLYRNYLIPKTVADFKDSLSRMSISQDQIEIKTKVLEQNLVETFKKANENLWSDNEFFIALPSFYQLINNYTNPETTNNISDISLLNTLNNVKYSDQDENEFKYQLSNVLNWILKECSTSNNNGFNNGITIRKDVDLALFKDYEVNQIGYSVDEIIKPEDMSKLFDFTYSKVYGCDYANEFFLDDIEPTEVGEYNKDVFCKLYETKELSTFDSPYATYGLNEILPGFQFNAEIVTLDSTTDSHSCHLEVKIGISHSSNPDYVLWSDFFNEDLTQEETPPLIKADLPCLKNDDVINVSNNVYKSDYDKQSKEYRIDLGEQKTEKYKVINPDSKETEEVDVYFCDSTKDRSYIDDIMEKYEDLDDSDEYDLKKYPVILDENATKGVINEEQWKKINELNSEENKAKNFHKNQYIAPIATRIDTINNILWINLCIVDNFNGQILPVYKDIGWNIKIDGKDHFKKCIPVKYNLNPNKQDTIDAMKTLFLSFTDSIIYSARSAAFYSQDDLDQVLSVTKETLNLETARVSLQTITLASLIATIAFSVAELIITKNVATVLDVVLGMGFIPLTVTLLAISALEFMSIKFGMKTISDFADLHKVTSKYVDKFNEAEKIISPEKIEEIVKKLDNPLLKYSKQLDLALEIRELINAYENTLGIEFVKDMFEEFPRYFGDNEYLQKDFDLLIKTWGNLPELTFGPGDPDNKIREMYKPFFSTYHKFITYGPTAITSLYSGYLVRTIYHFANTVAPEIATIISGGKFTVNQAISYLKNVCPGLKEGLAQSHKYIKTARNVINEINNIRTQMQRIWGSIVKFLDEDGKEVSYIFTNCMDRMTFLGTTSFESVEGSMYRFVVPYQFSEGEELASIRGFRVNFNTAVEEGERFIFSEINCRDTLDITISKISNTRPESTVSVYNRITNLAGERLNPRRIVQFTNFKARNIEIPTRVTDSLHGTEEFYTEENPLFSQSPSDFDPPKHSDITIRQGAVEEEFVNQATEELEEAAEVSTKCIVSKVLKIIIFLISMLSMIADTVLGFLVVDPTKK